MLLEVDLEHVEYLITDNLNTDVLNVRKLNYRSILLEIKDLNMDYIVIVESVEASTINSANKKRRAKALLKSIN